MWKPGLMMHNDGHPCSAGVNEGRIELMPPLPTHVLRSSILVLALLIAPLKNAHGADFVCTAEKVSLSSVQLGTFHRWNKRWAREDLISRTQIPMLSSALFI